MQGRCDQDLVIVFPGTIFSRSPRSQPKIKLTVHNKNGSFFAIALVFASEFAWCSPLGMG